MKRTINLAFSKDRTKIGCPIAQAVLGGEITNIAACFDSDLWEINPIECKLFSLPLDRLPDAVVKIGGSRSMAESAVRVYREEHP